MEPSDVRCLMAVGLWSHCVSFLAHQQAEWHAAAGRRIDNESPPQSDSHRGSRRTSEVSQSAEPGHGHLPLSGSLTQLRKTKGTVQLRQHEKCQEHLKTTITICLWGFESPLLLWPVFAMSSAVSPSIEGGSWW